MEGENKELKRLQFYGAGPKMAGYNLDKKEEKTRGKVMNFEFDPVRLHASPLKFWAIFALTPIFFSYACV